MRKRDAAIIGFIALLTIALALYFWAGSFFLNSNDPEPYEVCYDCGCDTWMKQNFTCQMSDFNKSEAARCLNEYFHEIRNSSYSYGVIDISVAYMEPSTNKFSLDYEGGYVKFLTLSTYGLDAQGNLYWTGDCG